MFNLSIPEDLKLETDIQPEFYYRTPSQSLSLSVVLPSYNSKKEVTVVLQHLSRQKLAKEIFEVILVDDGSSDEHRGVFERTTFSKGDEF